jgi:hypothetical protein
VLRTDRLHHLLSLPGGEAVKRATVTFRGRGPITRYADRLKAKTTAKLSQECGWQKPLIKLPKEGKQQ